MSHSADRAAELSPQEKRALLARLLQNKASAPRTYPLSFAQERLWFLDQRDPGNACYNVCAAFRLTGRLDIVLVERIVAELVHRHEVLRTIFVLVGGAPVQMVVPDWPLALEVVDMRGILTDEREVVVRQRLTAAARQTFNLTRGPLGQVTLLRLRDDEHILCAILHHIIADGWSMGVFIREVLLLYGALSKGQPSPLPELSIQYGDYAVWQRQWLQGEVLAPHLAYWRQQLADLPALAFPTDFPRPAVQTFQGASLAWRLPLRLVEGLRTLSRQAGVTLFQTLLAGLQILLRHYSGQDDIVVGSPIANRTRAELEGLIGCFFNYLVLRTHLGGNPSFLEVLQRVHAVCMEAYAHQDLPFTRLEAELVPMRELSNSSLFQVLFALHNQPLPALNGVPLRPQLERVETLTTQCDFEVLSWEDAEGLRLEVLYSTALFAMETMTRLIGDYQCLLEALVLAPAQRLSAVVLLRQSHKDCGENPV